MDEQAESSALDSAGDLSDLASFLADTPEKESEDENEDLNADDSTLNEDTDEDADDGQEDSEASEDGEEDPTPTETKVTIKVKNDNGEDETLELTQDEIAKSYMRQKDYTAKTTALAERESQAVEFLKSKHDEIRSQYLHQAEVQRAAIANMAGIKTDDEMAQLANSDPAAWVAEQQRQRQINGYLSQLDQQISGEKQRAQAEAEALQAQRMQQAYQAAWNELSKDGIDKPKLVKIYADVSKSYGFTESELASLYDHRLVRVFKDAAELRELKARKSEVTKKVMDAPRMPSKQAPNPAQERKSKELEGRFRSGRAKLNDLAAYLR